jgi:hypothetical protein
LQECFINEVIQYVTFSDWLFYSTEFTWNPSKFLSLPEVHSFIMLSCISWHVCLSIYTLNDTWVVFKRKETQQVFLC